MKRWGALALLALLAGCASTKYNQFVDTVKAVTKSNRVETPTAATVASKPFYQLQAMSPDGQATMVLGGVEGDIQGWYGQRGDGLFVERGLVVRTVGLRVNLDDTRWPSGNPFDAGLQRLNGAVSTTRVVDWSPGYRYGVTENIQLVPVRMESVEILGVTHVLRRIDETVSAPVAGFVAHNTYWVDPADGFIWRSHQVVAPGMPLDLFELRPYRENQP